MNKILEITLLGFIAGSVGTGIGGFSSLFFKKPSKQMHSFILGFSAGLMIAIVCFDLLPKAFLSGMMKALIGVVMGVVLITLMDERLAPRFSGDNMKDDFLRTGTLMGLSIAAHNFPEGLAIGSALAVDPTLGISLALIIMIHNIPEGMAMAGPFSISGLPRIKILLYTVYAGLPMGVGALIGAYIGNISEIFIGMCLGFAAGAMLYITCQEIIPKSSILWKGRTSGLSTIFGLLCGIILIQILH